ncbi:CG18446, partial [Drosophila busckii]
EIPTSIATPPQSPPGMPTLTSMLTNNNCVPPGLVMHMPCYLCKQPFSDVTKLSEHLILHAIEIH